MRDWAPGDVAMVRNEWDVWNVAIYSVRPGGFVWSYGVSDAVSPPTAEARPLVVIDPEDREQVERLWMAQDRAIPLIREQQGPAVVGVSLIDALQVGLRWMLNPSDIPALPKLEEPTGLGAVVEDRDGERWVLYTSPMSTAPWCDGSTSVEWDDIAVVRVLSEGVTP
ncbi:hypothetical protein [Nocardioides sp. URHA0032]|uniref:hypothetical protein n=1 Tax=Nocardioides sp. URHA0032 TaxID=1380388 RepID=UPI000ABEB1B7|nr:hypothetical protein [Nocardioides sp. URHA0032]